MELQNISNILTDRMTSYSAYVLLNRAIPNIYDGMKPVHRRILYSMYKHKTYNYAKSANVAGRVMMIHPHGSSYGSMVGMVQKDRHENPLLEGKGNFGQYTSSDLQPAADRYSEVRLSSIAKTMLQNFDKKVVNFIDNYDGTQKVPELLPVQYPAILTQAQKGIGVGFSSSIPSYNLKEVCQATIDYIDNKQINLVPDFATGGYIENDEEQFESIMNEGKGSVKLRGKCEINGNEIKITEIPYGVKREKIISDIIKGVKDGTLSDIKNVNDLTDLKGMSILITLKKSADANITLELLYKHTSLESKYSANINVLADEKLKVLGVKDIISKWIEWRKQCVKNVIDNDIEELSKKVHLYKGLEKVLFDIDKAIEIIRTTSSKQVNSKLQNQFDIDDKQSEFVLKMQLRNINKDYLQQKIDEIEEMKQELDELTKKSQSDNEQYKIIKKDLRNIIKQFGKERFTEISDFKVSKSTEKAIKTKQTKQTDRHIDEVIITKQGFLYKNYKQQDIKLSPGDEIVSTLNNVSDNSFIYVLFKKSTEAVGILANDIKESNTKSIGQHINSFNNNYNDDEPILLINSQSDNNIIYVFDNGKAITFSTSEFNVKRKLLRNAKADATLLYAKQYDKDYDLIIKTDKKRNKNITINTKDISYKKSRNGAGTYITKHNILSIEED